jgi:hypothetical protein
MAGGKAKAGSSLWREGRYRPLTVQAAADERGLFSKACRDRMLLRRTVRRGFIAVSNFPDGISASAARLTVFQVVDIVVGGEEKRLIFPLSCAG